MEVLDNRSKRKAFRDLDAGESFYYDEEQVDRDRIYIKTKEDPASGLNAVVFDVDIREPYLDSVPSGDLVIPVPTTIIVGSTN